MQALVGWHAPEQSYVPGRFGVAQVQVHIPAMHDMPLIGEQLQTIAPSTQPNVHAIEDFAPHP